MLPGGAAARITAELRYALAAQASGYGRRWASAGALAAGRRAQPGPSAAEKCQPPRYALDLMTMPSTASAVTTNSFSQKLEGKATMAGGRCRRLRRRWQRRSRADVPLGSKRRRGGQGAGAASFGADGTEATTGADGDLTGGGSLCLKRALGWQGAVCAATGGRCERGSPAWKRCEQRCFLLGLLPGGACVRHKILRDAEK